MPRPKKDLKRGFEVGDVLEYVHPTTGTLCRGMLLSWDRYRKKFRVYWCRQQRILSTKPFQFTKDNRYTRVARGFDLVPIEREPVFKIIAFDPDKLTCFKPGVHKLPGTTMEFLQSIAADGRFSIDLSTDPPTICFQNMLDVE